MKKTYLHDLRAGLRSLLQEDEREALANHLEEKLGLKLWKEEE